MTPGVGAIGRAMLLAAGRGERLRPLTDRCPKPLVDVGGQTLIGRILDRLDEVGTERVVVNLHHLGDMIEAHLAGRPRPQIVFSREVELLETGGGTKKALSLLGPAPFFAINGDVLWFDGQVPALTRLTSAWDGERMDALLLLVTVENAIGYDGAGDFDMDAQGRLIRRGTKPTAPYVFAGIQILHPRLFATAPDGAFSLNVLYDAAQREGRLFGLCHDGGWLHIGTMAGLADARRRMADRSS
ncbi:MAG: nucleotidyltransferase family protein [Alphaproteobacteria bacterium]